MYYFRPFRKYLWRLFENAPHLFRRMQFAPPEEPYDPFSPDTEARREEAKRKEAEELQRQRRSVEATILSTPAGREWLWQFLSECHVFEARFSMTGERENGFWEGQREIGLNLMRRLASTSPENFARMLGEHNV